MCHILLLLPIFALPLFLFLPREVALPVYIAVSAVSAALYWLIWRAMRQPAKTGIEGMMGGIGTVWSWLCAVARHRPLSLFMPVNGIKRCGEYGTTKIRLTARVLEEEKRK